MLQLFFVVILIIFSMGQMSKENDDIDPIIDMLLNSPNCGSVSNDVKDGDPIMNGIWKCGNCTDITNYTLMFTETDDMDDSKGELVEIQISLSLEGMRCVTISADTPGLVRKVSGACDSDTVTLHISPTRQATGSNKYIIRVYD